MKKLIFIFCSSLIAFGFILIPADDFVSVLRSKFKIFQQAHKPVTLELTFHQPKYAAGDSVFFRTLYLNAGTRTAVQGKQIVNLTLQDPAGTVVMVSQYAVQDGFGEHTFIVPSNLKPGNYKLGAYTQWMKNLDPALFYDSEFTIAGRDLLVPEPNGVSVNFYPEGGTLVGGIQNNVLIGSAAQFRNKTGFIKRNEAVISELRFDSDGFARTAFIPDLTQKYFLEVEAGGEMKRFPLPEVQDEGFALQVRKGPARNFVLAVSASEKIRSSSEKFYVVLTDADGFFYSQPLNFAGTDAIELTIPSKGIKHHATLSILDEDSRLWASRPVLSGGEDELKTTISKGATTYSTREVVKITVDVQDESGNPQDGHFAVRIIPQGLFGDERATGSSQNNDNENIAFLKNRMWLDWKKVSEEVKPLFTPQKYLVVSGTATLLESGKPVQDSTLISFFFEKDVFGYEVYTNSAGEFTFPILYDFKGDQEVFYAGSYKGRDVNGLKISLKQNEILTGDAAPRLIASSQPDAYGMFAGKKEVIDQSYLFYADSQKTQKIEGANSLIEDELGGADIAVDLNNYVVFPSMAEVIKEVLPSVEHRKTGEEDVIRVYTSHKRASKFAQPLYVIDGRVTKDTRIFLGLDPQQINTIKIVREGNKLIRLGTLFSNGVILVETKNRGLRNRIGAENRITVMGLLANSKADVGDAMHKPSNVPDLRSCLYWNPRVPLTPDGSASFSLSTSDDVGVYKIEITGITANGKYFSAEDTIEVRFRK